MKLCPECGDEFLEHIELCPTCEVSLVVDASQLKRSNRSSGMSKEELLKGETVPLLEGSLAHCREIERVLERAEIGCAVYPLSLNCDSNAATLGSSCDMRYMVLVRVIELDEAKEALRGQFFAQVAKEGMGDLVTEAVDLEQEIINCPACGNSGALQDGECQSCGLYLKVLEEEG